MHRPDRVPKERFRVGEFDVLPDRNLLLRNGEEFHVEPKVIDVLCVLASRCGEVVSREDLIRLIWDVKFGADESLTRAVSLLRKCLRTAAGGASYIETVPKRGYRLNAEVKPISSAVPRLKRGSRQTGPRPALPTRIADRARLPVDALWIMLALIVIGLAAAALLSVARARAAFEPIPLAAGSIEVGAFPLDKGLDLAVFAWGLGVMSARSVRGQVAIHVVGVRDGNTRFY